MGKEEGDAPDGSAGASEFVFERLKLCHCGAELRLWFIRFQPSMVTADPEAQFSAAMAQL